MGNIALKVQVVSAIVLAVNAQEEKAEANTNLMLFAVLAGCLLLLALFMKGSQKKEFSEQLTVQEVISKESGVTKNG